MPCRYLRSKSTGALLAIVCGARQRARRCKCGADSSFQCDWKVGDGKTCDKYLCATCAQEVAPEKHLCPDHQAAYRKWLAKATQRALEKASAPSHESPTTNHGS